MSCWSSCTIINPWVRILFNHTRELQILFSVDTDVIAYVTKRQAARCHLAQSQNWDAYAKWSNFGGLDNGCRPMVISSSFPPRPSTILWYQLWGIVRSVQIMDWLHCQVTTNPSWIFREKFRQAFFVVHPSMCSNKRDLVRSCHILWDVFGNRNCHQCAYVDHPASVKRCIPKIYRVSLTLRHLF